MVILGFARSMLPLGGGVKYILGIIGNLCMGVLLYLLLFTLLADLILLIPKLIKLSFTTHRFFKGFVAVGVVVATLATCVYGSYDCPQVWTLRRYRDITLASTWYGRAFVRVYYAVSPTLVRWFGGYNWFKKFWKGRLDAMVHRLQKDGVDSTPYQDRSW